MRGDDGGRNGANLCRQRWQIGVHRSAGLTKPEEPSREWSTHCCCGGPWRPCLLMHGL